SPANGRGMRRRPSAWTIVRSAIQSSGRALALPGPTKRAKLTFKINSLGGNGEAQASIRIPCRESRSLNSQSETGREKSRTGGVRSCESLPVEEFQSSRFQQ